MEVVKKPVRKNPNIVAKRTPSAKLLKMAKKELQAEKWMTSLAYFNELWNRDPATDEYLVVIGPSAAPNYIVDLSSKPIKSLRGRILIELALTLCVFVDICEPAFWRTAISNGNSVRKWLTSFVPLVKVRKSIGINYDIAFPQRAPFVLDSVINQIFRPIFLLTA